MKKLIKKAMQQENESFESWVQEHNVSLPEQKPTRISRNSLVMRWATVATSIIVIALAIALPIALSNRDTSNTTIRYLATDSVAHSLELEELFLLDNFLLPNFNQILNHESAFVHTAYDNPELVLSYTINQLLYVTQDETNAFFIDYRIRTFRNYDFRGYEAFDDLSLNMTVNEILIYYDFVESNSDFDAAQTLALIHFSYGDSEYFLIVAGFEGITEITSDTLRILLTELLT